MSGAHALTPAALTSCARVGSFAIARILFEHMSRARRPLLMTTGTRVWTLNPVSSNGIRNVALREYTNNCQEIRFRFRNVQSVY